MSFTMTVLYPKLEADDWFKLDYYTTEHVNLIKDSWSGKGLKSWEIVKYAPSLDGSPAPYHVGAILTWESAEAAKAALTAPDLKGVREDTPNFTNTKPIVLFATVEASSS
ncbi:hypothetical protein HJFPF1_08045 [Paramyrothecium foliicola]|nr:hypothetical protein HJFPF1_08045 [Paramyrothecium foliicola]